MNLFQKFHNFLNFDSIWKNIFLIISGTLLAQGIGILATPIVTRLYLPQDYGILTSFNSVISILTITASLDYHKAIPLAKNDKQVINLIFLSVVILVLITLSLNLVLYFFGEAILDNLNLNDLLNFKFYLPLALFFMGIYKIFLEYALRNRDYKAITKTSISQSSFSNFFRIILGYFNSGAIGLILSAIIGKSFGLYTLIKPLFSIKKINNYVNKRNFLNVFVRYKRYPLYSTPSNLVYTLGNDLPVLFILSFFGSSEVGLFGLANNMINIPLSLVGMSVSQVFFAEAAKIGKHNPIELKKISTKLVSKLAIFGIIPLFFVFVFGPQVFSFVFGNEWYEAGEYAGVLSVMVYFHLLILPIGRLLEILELQKFGLIFNVLRLICIGLVFFVSLKLNLSSINTIICYSLINSFFYLLLMLFIFKILKKNSLLCK
jgi:O-antigen/teichoic acid export membrane protein